MRRTLIGCFGALALAAPLATAAELKIAVVDFHKAFMAYERRDELRKELETQRKKFNDELAKIEDTLKAKQAELETMEPGTDKYREFQLELIKLETLLQVTKKQAELELDRAQRTHMQRLIGEVEKQIQLFAQENAIDLVLAKYMADPRSPLPVFIALYSRPDLDITEKLIERLNRGKTGGK